MNILIATDGSEFSQSAIDQCCRVYGKADDITLKIISAGEVTTSVPTEPFMVSADYVNEMNAESRRQAHNYAAQAVTQIQKCFPALAINLTSVTELGSPAQIIIAEAEKWHADLIVVGSHGRGFWERMFLGSVSQAVVQHAPCSVLVVRKPINNE